MIHHSARVTWGRFVRVGRLGGDKSRVQVGHSVFFFVWGGGDVFEVGFWMEENEGKRPFFFFWWVFVCFFLAKRDRRRAEQN